MGGECSTLLSKGLILFEYYTRENPKGSTKAEPLFKHLKLFFLAKTTNSYSHSVQSSNGYSDEHPSSIAGSSWQRDSLKK